jgi:hypothetical protein
MVKPVPRVWAGKFENSDGLPLPSATTNRDDFLSVIAVDYGGTSGEGLVAAWSTESSRNERLRHRASDPVATFDRTGIRIPLQCRIMSIRRFKIEVADAARDSKDRGDAGNSGAEDDHPRPAL